MYSYVILMFFTMHWKLTDAEDEEGLDCAIALPYKPKTRKGWKKD